MYRVKYFFTLILIFILSISCSLVNNLKEKVSKKDGSSTDSKEKIETTSTDDLAFYNKYIEVANKISEIGDGLYKEYLNGVPEPKSITKNSMILALGFDFKVNDLERLIKEYKRSYFENGELAKLKTDNSDMREEIETEFKNLLNILEEYHKTARKVSDYYKNKEFQTDLSLAKVYDEDLRRENDKYKEAFDRFNNAVKKYKPKKTKRNPETISNPDEKAIAILMNAYENTLDGAEAFHEKLEKMDKNSDVADLTRQLDEFERNFESDKKTVLSVEFTDMTKYLKYSFEDYFNKTVTDFVREARKFLEEVQRKKMDQRKFDSGYDNVINYYNYMINAYNTSITTLNTFKVYY